MARQRVLHQCLCEFRAKTYAHYRRHQESCAVWRNRPNPRGLSIYRRMKPRGVGVPTEKELRADPAFRCVLENRISPKLFSAFLRVLARRYNAR